MKLPFGKHKGEDITDVPLHYLKWFEENVESLTASQRADINFESSAAKGIGLEWDVR